MNTDDCAIKTLLMQNSSIEILYVICLVVIKGYNSQLKTRGVVSIMKHGGITKVLQ